MPSSASISNVHPGEAAVPGRIFDVVEPRAKAPGSGIDFPGISARRLLREWERLTS